MPHITRRTSAIAGLLVAPVFVGVIILLTLIERDFLRSLGWSLTGNNEVPYPSAIARGDVGFLQELNFLVTATLAGIFAVGFRREFRRRIAGLVATAGFCLVVVGVLLNLAPTDLPDEPTTWHGNVHVIGFLITVLGWVIAYSASGLALRGNPAWRRWRLLGWTPVLLVLIFLAGGLLPGDVGFCLFIVVGFGWYTLMGGRLLALDQAERIEQTVPSLPDPAAPGLL
jgi:hypothetical protein